METGDDVVLQAHNTETKAFGKNKIICLEVIAAVTIFAGGFAIGKIYQAKVDVESVSKENSGLTKSDQERDGYNDSNQSTWALPQGAHRASESDGHANNETNEVVIDITGHILAIKDGDVWQIDANGENAVKLIDLDTISSVSRSDLSNKIAYTLKQQVETTIEWYDGSQRNVEVPKSQLYLADQKGSNSQLIYDGVASWGWIPDSDSLWYETASSEVVGGGMFPHSYKSTGEVWVFDLTTQESSKILDIDDSNAKGVLDSELLVRRVEWSPDGQKMMYLSENALYVINKNTLNTQKLFSLPYVGGDRGGPQPIPFFQWSPDSTAIYTVFTPFALGDEDEDRQIDFQTKHVAALKIPIDGSAIERVIPEVPSQIANEETYPRAHFSDDFTKVFYPRVNSVQYPDTMRAQEDVSLVMYDLVTKEEITLLDNFGKTERGLMQYRTPLSWVVNKYVYVLKGDGDWLSYDGATLSLVKINIKTGAQEILAVKENVSKNVWDIKFEPKSETVYFTADQGLVRLSSSGTSVIADDIGLGQVSYYFE